MANFYQVEKEINGVKYVAQHNGLTAALEAVDNSYIDNSPNTSLVKINNYILKNVIVEPHGLKIDDFADIDALNEVIAFGRGVMQGEIKPNSEKETKSTKKAE